MAQLIVSMNLSLDGYIEAQGQDDGSWLRIDEVVHRAFNELAASAEACLYGRKVYEVMIPYWPDAVEDATKPAHERDYGRIWVDKPKVVFSTTLTETRWNTRVVPSGARDEVLRLKNESRGTCSVTGVLSSCRISKKPGSWTNTRCSSIRALWEPACRSFGVAWT